VIAFQSVSRRPGAAEEVAEALDGWARASPASEAGAVGGCDTVLSCRFIRRLSSPEEELNEREALKDDSEAIDWLIGTLAANYY